MIPLQISFDFECGFDGRAMSNVRFILFYTFFCVRGIVLDMIAMRSV